MSEILHTGPHEVIVPIHGLRTVTPGTVVEALTATRGNEPSNHVNLTVVTHTQCELATCTSHVYICWRLHWHIHVSILCYRLTLSCSVC